MKQKSLFFAVLVLLVSNIFCIAGWNKSINDTALLYDYYKGAEELLDTLENQYGWVDAIDMENYYTATHNIRERW